MGWLRARLHLATLVLLPLALLALGLDWLFRGPSDQDTWVTVIFLVGGLALFALKLHHVMKGRGRD